MKTGRFSSASFARLARDPPCPLTEGWINNCLRVLRNYHMRQTPRSVFSKIPTELKYVEVSEWQATLQFLTRLLGILGNNSTSRYTAVNYSDVRCGGRQRKWQLGDSSLIIVLLLWPLWNKWSYLSGSEVGWREEKDGLYLRERREKGICKECSADRISEWQKASGLNKRRDFESRSLAGKMAGEEIESPCRQVVGDNGLTRLLWCLLAHGGVALMCSINQDAAHRTAWQLLSPLIKVSADILCISWKAGTFSC